ncbi:MAG: CRISPR system precrRNA processing endoribonuclease RAMP protein Cas6 [Desulfomonilaceae bacterium]|nr:CRISPR system precrRNA processing endoribonuclease RAMP protein Cas6 [Desulfomonilaceae bacterium]
MEVPYGEYRFRSELEHDAVLPRFKGSTIRGVFGTALRRVVCALKHQECARCLLREKCLFNRAFVTPGDGAQAQQPAAPHPFVIEPPETHRTHFEKGEPLDVVLMLFGWAHEFLPYFVYAFKEMGTIGIGRKIDGIRGAFRLKAITCAHGTVYDAASDRLKTLPPAVLKLEEPSPECEQVRHVTVSLQTPLRLKHNNRFHSQLEFHILVRAALRRITALHAHYGTGELDLDYRGLVSRAMQVETAGSKIDWVDWRRYSNRRQQEMLMGGLMGEVTYVGRINEFLPLIRFCEKVHLGKATTFGLGKIRVVEEDAGGW